MRTNQKKTDPFYWPSILPPINPYQASVYHLSAFGKSDLQSLLLSHTSYTFPRSGFTKEEYDIAGMERKVVERFVLSNPRLEGEVKKVQYLEDRTGREEDQLDTKIAQSELDNNLQGQLGKDISRIRYFLQIPHINPLQRWSCPSCQISASCWRTSVLPGISCWRSEASQTSLCQASW